MKGPLCPEWRASRKISPAAVSVSLPTIVTTGGCSRGAEWKVCVRGLLVPPELGGSNPKPMRSKTEKRAESGETDALTVAETGVAIWKEKCKLRAPGAPTAHAAPFEDSAALTE